MAPIEEMGLPMCGRDPQRRHIVRPQGCVSASRPPHVLLTTPESLSLAACPTPRRAQLFAGLKRVVIDEVHAFATGKRGDLLALVPCALAGDRAQMRRAALSADAGRP